MIEFPKIHEKFYKEETTTVVYFIHQIFLEVYGKKGGFMKDLKKKNSTIE